MNQKDLFIKKEWAEITDLGKEEQENCVRVYCTSYPDNFNFQIRTFKPTRQGGVNRQMIATANLTIKDVKKILSYMENER